MFASAAAAALIVASASAAQAGDTYAQVDAGIVAGGSYDLTVDDPFFSGSMSSDAEIGFLLSGRVGKELDNGFAVEGELLVTHNGVDADELGLGDVTNTNTLLMVNAKYAFHSDKDVSPYVGAGVGYGQSQYEFADVGSDDDNGVAWQLLAGFTYKKDGRVWDFGYRYIDTPEYKIGDSGTTVTVEGDIHAVTLGVRF
nr:outer membrane beta-barrel protein [Caulobacter sp. 17J65-9]